MALQSEVFTVEHEGAVATLWLDDPDRRNAMGPAFWNDLPREGKLLLSTVAIESKE